MPGDATGTMLNETALAGIVLSRLYAAGSSGCARSQVMRDLMPLGAAAAAEVWRGAIDRVIEGALVTGAIGRAGDQLRLTEAGSRSVLAFLGTRPARSADWTEIRDVHLVGKALGLRRTSLKRLRLLQTGLGLRRRVIELGLGIDFNGARGPAGMRNVLAGEASRQGLKARSRRRSKLSPAAAARSLAASLLAGRPRVESDDRLVTLLAAEQVGAERSEVTAVRMALLRRLVFSEPEAAIEEPERPAPRAAPPPGEFAARVRELARGRATGWPGNRKAFIAHVWQEVVVGHPDWGLDEETFKALLIEAHRDGRLQLTGADLRDKVSLPDIEASAVTYKNTAWHLIRVEDE